LKEDRVYVKHILRCISRIEEYTAEGREAFFSSPLIQDGTLRNLQTMAESTQRLSERLRIGYPEVDWKALAGFRNVLVHDYLGVDLNSVYQAVAQDMPKLRLACEAMLRELDSTKRARS
jgi:uncharacterized protein with HEPN domain